MKTISATEFKAHCLAILDEVARTGETILITKRGRPVVEVYPAVERSSEFPQLDLRGTGRIVGDIISPVLPPEGWDAERGILIDDRP